jgi:catechol 2,3-dioxygenase-like lactoylglutathione lyase family enzyme
MPRLNGILETALYVEDLERAVRFYQALFGFEVVASSERLVALGVPGPQIFLLCKKKAALHLQERAHDGEGQLHVAFAIRAEDLNDWEIRLKEQNITIVEKKQWELGGWSLYFRDPDQHLIELATPGVWCNY